MTKTLVQPQLFHRPQADGRRTGGPGDLYTFLVTGEESGGAYFSMLAVVPPLGGPPPHIHRDEDETFYVLDGTPTFRLADEGVVGRPGRLRERAEGRRAQLPQPLRPAAADDPHVHARRDRALLRGDPGARLDLTQPCPDNLAEVGARYAEAAPRYGMEFFLDA